ncbi:MAG: collagen-like protein, partial [Eudoraea sp.]|nr:collagen-like protein [Eudoraea sp.]
MHKLITSLLLIFFSTFLVQAQLKVGDNPDEIDGASLLELESRNKVLVLSRVNTALMLKIKPLAGALVYNTDESCVYHYNGKKWNSLCSATNGSGVVLEQNEDGSITVINADGSRFTFNESSSQTESGGGKENTGSQGPKGDKGDPGEIGPQGPEGPQGPKGEKGDKGDRGETGSAGPAGADGADGAVGPQ